MSWALRPQQARPRASSAFGLLGRPNRTSSMACAFVPVTFKYMGRKVICVVGSAGRCARGRYEGDTNAILTKQQVMSEGGLMSTSAKGANRTICPALHHSTTMGLKTRWIYLTSFCF